MKPTGKESCHEVSEFCGDICIEELCVYIVHNNGVIADSRNINVYKSTYRKSVFSKENSTIEIYI